MSREIIFGEIDGITEGIRYPYMVIYTIDPEFFKNSIEVDSAVADEILPNFLRTTRLMELQKESDIHIQ